MKLAELARRYVETLGQPKQVETLAKWSDYAPSSISKLIRRARERHLLTPTSKGRPGGQLTPRAKTLLGEVPAKRVADREQWTEWMFGPEAARQEKEKNR